MKAFLALAIAAASVVASARQGRPRHDSRLEKLTVDAAAAPAEFEADALLRIAGASSVDSSWRRELIEQAFLRSYGAQETYRRISFGIPTESRQGAMLLAYDTRLTQVSLQTRAAQMMALVDGPHARELFQWITTGIERTPCEETLVPSIPEYYTALSQLARTTYPAAERGEAMRFFEYYLWRAHLPSEMPAVALAIQRFRPTSEEATHLEMLLRFVFEGAVRDPRGFSVAAIDIVSKVGDLEDTHGEMGLTTHYLSRILRAYLRSQLTGPRCADSSSEPVAVETFNARIRRTRAIEDGITPLEAADSRASSVLPAARLDMYWQTADARRLQAQYVSLRGTGRNPVAESMRMQQWWRDQASHFVADLDHWNGSREASVVDFFYQKAVLFSEVLNLMPPGPERARTLRAFIDFLRHTDLDRTRRSLWFVFNTRLLELAHGNDRDAILDAMENSGHPTLSLYARLERVLPEQTRTSPRPVGPRFSIGDERRHP